MTESERIINTQSYINMIFNEIKRRWPELFNHIMVSASNQYGINIFARNLLVNTIGHDGINNYYSIIEHIEKNEHMIEWWIL